MTVEPLTTVQVTLIVSAGLLVYSYVGYPILLAVLALFRREEQMSRHDPLGWPQVTVVISAYNEEAVISSRIHNLLGVDYPKDKLEILVGSDGSSDGTCEEVARYRSAGVKLLAWAARRGKASVLNDLLTHARGEFVVFTDANTFFEGDAIKELIRGFHQVRAACAVVGRLEFRTSSGTVNPDSLYWRYESFLKGLESRFGTLLGANGAIYAIRRVRYCPLPSGTIVDDFLIPLLMRLTGGGSVVFRPSAKAWELMPETVGDEFRRRVRIGAGDAHALLHSWRLLLPSHGMLAVSYWSHKVLRWLGPVLLLTVFLCNLVLLDRAWGQWLFAAQLVGYGLGLAAPRLRSIPVLGRIATAISYFMVLNAALLIGFVKFIRGMTSQTWQTTPRTAEAALVSGQRFAETKSMGEAERPVA